jgi:predicted XRE-type DNA-binding protein
MEGGLKKQKNNLSKVFKDYRIDPRVAGKISEFLETKTEEQRLAFVLVSLGMKQREIAATVGVSQQKISRWIHRDWQPIREILIKEIGGRVRFTEDDFCVCRRVPSAGKLPPLRCL